MATTTSITTTYAGEKAASFISAALLSSNTIEKGGMEVKPNIKFKQVLRKLETGDLINDGSCDFDATSSVTLTERTIEPKEFQVNLALCKKDFRSDWDAISMGMSAHDNLPKSFQDYLLAHVVAKVAAKNEQNIWNGADANAGEYAGLLELFAADADVIDVAATTIDASNVIDELGKVIDAIPAELYGNDDLSIYISQSTARAYVRAQAALGYKDLYHVGQTQMDFEGTRLMVCNGLPANKMVAAEKSNLFFGTGLMSDMNEVKVIDMADIDGSQNVRIVIRFTAAVQYAIGAEVVLYA
jgi:phosphotransferase system HPr-like phosphotransfer protein